MSSTVSECPICFEVLGKIHRTIQCGHKFHHKCLKKCESNEVNNHRCPYCRQQYDNMVLRKRKIFLTKKELEQKNKFSTEIKQLLDKCVIAKGVKNRFLNTLQIYKKMYDNINILSNPKFEFNKFLVVVKSKATEITEQINNVIKEQGMNYIGKQNFDNWVYYREKVVSNI